MKISTRIFFILLFIAFTGAYSNAQSGNALSYDGTDDYLTMPSNLVSGLTQDFTIEAWVYWRGGNDWQRIFDFGNGTGEYIFLTPASDPGNLNQVMFAMRIAGFPEIRVTGAGAIMPTNTWTHVAVTLQHSTNTASLYINGVLSGQNTGMTYRASQINTAQSWLGRSQYFGVPYFDPYFNGVIDQFRISDNVRYTGNFTPASLLTDDANTVVLYHFEEGDPSQITDAEGTNAFTATLGSTGGVDTNDPTWLVTSTLPVFILEFDGQKSGNAILLKWKAYTTGAGGQFVIERSFDRSHFIQVGTVKIEDLSGTYSYQYSDPGHSNGNNYYRIKILETNADVKYSRMIVVDGQGKTLYTAYPTAASTQIFVKVPEATNILLYNSAGMLVRKVRLNQSQNINISDLGRGAYHMQFEGTREIVRFIKL